MKRSFFQAAVASILLYGCTTWTLTKRLEKKLDGNYTRMLRSIFNKSWRQHPTRHQLYGHLPPITKIIQVRRTRHAGHWPCKKRDDQHEHTFSNYVRIRDVVRKTCLRRWTIGKSGEKGSGISVLPARHDDDDDDDLDQMGISIHIRFCNNFPPKNVINKTSFLRVEIIKRQFWKIAYLVYFRIPKEE